MKFQTALFALIVVTTSISFAKGPAVEAPQDEAISSKGFRVAILKPFLKEDTKGSEGTSLKTLGFSAGYANLPVGHIGWTANLSYIDVEESPVVFYRLDGNAAYAFTKYFNIKGGLNFSKATGNSSEDSLNPGFGLQASLGLQISENFGIDVGYTQMNQSKNSKGVNFEFKESGVEVGFNVTF